MVKKSRLFIILAFFMALVTIRAPVSVHADGVTTFPASMKGSLTIRYFDDEDDKIPVTNAEFDVYQVSQIGRNGDENGMYLPLRNDFDFTKNSNSSAKDYQKIVSKAYNENPSLGYYKHVKTGADGLAKLSDMPVGAYLVCETQAARYHIKTIPFLVSVPEMNDKSNAWNFDVSTEPKSNIAGDLKVTKKITGNDPKNTKDIYTFKVRMADGEYNGVDAHGKPIVVKDGSRIKLKGGQSFTIYDLPEKSDFRVTETEANKNGYTTTYRNKSGRIKGKSLIQTTVTNHRNKITIRNFVTGVLYDPTMMLIFTGACATLILFLIISHKQRKEDAE